MSRTVQRALADARACLAEAGVAQADLDARWLMAAALGVAQDRVILHLSEPLTDETDATFQTLLAERLMGRPISHILGGRWFFGRWFRVTPAVLDPRPDTETLVELALQDPFDRVLDLGTGSGCILISLLAERAEATGLGVDLSPEALEVARQNADSLGVSDRADLKLSDWMSDVSGQFDLVVSNPPYVSAAAYEGLEATVREFDPKLALTPGGDGLDPYRTITANLHRVLAPGGRCLVEIGYDQGPQVAALFSDAGLEDVAIHPDINGKDRVVSGRCAKATLREFPHRTTQNP